MNLVDQIQFGGIFEINIFKSGTLIERYIDKNLVVTVGKTKLCMLLANDGTDNYIKNIAFGTSSVNPTIVDTVITDEYSKDLEGYEYPSTKSVKFNFQLETTENNGMAISEFGLKCLDGTLFARKVRGVIQKESDVFISGSWTIVFA